MLKGISLTSNNSCGTPRNAYACHEIMNRSRSKSRHSYLPFLPVFLPFSAFRSYFGNDISLLAFLCLLFWTLPAFALLVAAADLVAVPLRAVPSTSIAKWKIIG
jgi:hypothetical protein